MGTLSFLPLQGDSGMGRIRISCRAVVVGSDGEVRHAEKILAITIDPTPDIQIISALDEKVRTVVEHRPQTLHRCQRRKGCGMTSRSSRLVLRVMWTALRQVQTWMCYERFYESCPLLCMVW